MTWEQNRATFLRFTVVQIWHVRTDSAIPSGPVWQLTITLNYFGVKLPVRQCGEEGEEGVDDGVGSECPGRCTADGVPVHVLRHSDRVDECR